MRPFLTDEHIARELKQIEDGWAHLEAMAPSMRRRAAALRQLLEPAGARTDSDDEDEPR